MRVMKHIVPGMIASLFVFAALATVGITVLVYSSADHREAVKAIAREFFVSLEKASRTRRPLIRTVPSPAPEGGTLQ